MSQGFAALPPMASTAMLYAALFGAALPLVKKFFPKIRILPSVGYGFWYSLHSSRLLLNGDVYRFDDPCAMAKDKP